MNISRSKLDLERARACMSPKDICNSGIKRGTWCSLISGRSVRPDTIGKLAKILGCDVTDLIDEGVN